LEFEVVVSKREKYIGIGTGLAIALLILDNFVVEPYFAQLDAIGTRHDLAAQTISNAATTFVRERKLQKIWTDMQSNGLKTDSAAADSQLQHALLDWANEAGVTPQVLKSDLTRKEGMFQVIGYRVTASGTMRSISRFLWALETASMPIRVTDVRVTPEREGTDDLSVQLGVSTLCAPAADEKPAVKPQVGTADMAGDEV
jgi:Type II secretion system (T2SS), protein M subtype b